MFLLHIIGFVLLVGVNGQASCPRGFEPHLTSCYHLSTDKETWPEAREICAMEGSYLVEINSVEEHYLLSNMTVSNDMYIWTGLNDLLVEGEYQWAHSKDILNSFGYWGDGEPDAGEGKNCVYYYEERDRTGRWSDTLCSYLRNYVCEVEQQTIVIG